MGTVTIIAAWYEALWVLLLCIAAWYEVLIRIASIVGTVAMYSSSRYDVLWQMDLRYCYYA